MKPARFFLPGLMAAAMWIAPSLSAAAPGAAPVIEVATFQLKQGVSPEEFAVVDQALERDYIAKQPGFVSRESAAGPNNEWLVIVHWHSLQDADASMAAFEKAASAAGFMAKLNAATMVMKRYQQPAN